MKLMIYPGSFEATVFTRYTSLMNEYDTVYLAGPRGWALPDLSEIREDDTIHFQPMPTFEEALALCDDVLFLDTDPPIPLAVLTEKMQTAIESGKRVYVDNGAAFARNPLPSESIQRVDNSEKADTESLKHETLPIYEIPVPVIFVMGTGPYSGKFDVQLSLRENFLKQGYKVSQIGSKRISSFFGFDALPAWVFKKDLTIHEKIVLLNRYFYRKCLDEKPDVLIVGIPGGLMPINPLVFEDLGETAFLVANAVRPDLAVLGVYAHHFTQAYFEELRSICKYRFNFDLKYIAVSNMDIMVSQETHKSEFTVIPPYTVEHEYLADKTGFSGFQLFNTLKQADMELLTDKIIQELKENL